MIHVIATIELRPGMRGAFLEEFARLVPDVRAEAGCIYYAGGIDIQTDVRTQAPVRPDAVVVVERWESVEALKAHSVAPHMQANRERVKDCVLGMVLHILDPV